MNSNQLFLTEEEKKEYLEYYSENDFHRKMLEGINEIDSYSRKTEYINKEIVCGAMMNFDNGTIDIINNLYIKNRNLILLSEVTAEYRRVTMNNSLMPFICTPHLFAKDIILYDMEVTLPRNLIYISRKKAVKDAALNIQNKFKRLGKGYALCWASYAYIYIDKLFASIKPTKVILWNQFYAFHKIIENICKKRNIKVIYMEFGCIPGTICIEKKGQLGESYPAIKFRKFSKLKVSNEECKKANEIINWLYENELNRNKQPQKNTVPFFSCSEKKILVIGQNDYESGLYVYNRKSKKYHSPLFETSINLLKYLISICKEEWQLLYRPHPLMTLFKSEKEEIDKLDVAVNYDGNINQLIDEADVVITLFSQCSYISLIRGKPVVQLGRNQLSNSGCIYETKKKHEIENTIEEAIKNGVSIEQKNRFIEHVARLLKYYLYSDGVKREKEVGRDLNCLNFNDLF